MISDDLIHLNASELARLIAKKSVSPVEVVEGYLERIERYGSTLHAYITVCGDEALAEARRAEEVVVRGESLGPLHGLPLAVKDQIDTKGVLTTSGSRSLGDNVPDADATAVARAKGAGAILLGKTTMTQFASGMGDPFQYGDPIRNPWNQERDTIGSSNGSGVAIAASMCSIALGEDTGGSIRCPSSATGVVGLRPTWGRVSRHGIFPLAWSMDTSGPMNRTVEDCAVLLGVIAGHDPKDPQTSRLPVPDYTKALSDDLNGLRIGVVGELVDPDYAEAEVVAAFRGAVAQLEELGATVEEASFPLVRDLIAAAAAVTSNDGSFVHRERIKANPQDYGRGLRRRLLAASLVPSHLLQKANRFRAVARSHWLELLRKFDVVVSPTLMYTLGKIKLAEPITSKEQAQGQFGKGSGDATITAAFTGTPALTLPCGIDGNGVPIGLQVMAGHFQEERVLRVGHAYEKSTDWHAGRPDL